MIVLRNRLANPFDWGEFLGLTIAACLALLAAEIGVQGYFRQRERDEVSRRWIDEGFTVVGRTTTADFERERSNLLVCKQVIDAARYPDSRPVIPEMLADLDRTTPQLGYEHRRLLAMLNEPRITAAFADAYGKLRMAHILFTSQVPAVVQVIDKIPTPDAALDNLNLTMDRTQQSVSDYEFILVDCISGLVSVFEGLQLEQHEQVRRAREIEHVSVALKVAGDRLDETLKKYGVFDKMPPMPDADGPPKV